VSKKNQPVHRFGKTIINPPGGLADIKQPKLNYVKHNPKGGIAAAMKMPNFVKRRRKAADGHEILEIDYT
jgi:hypothetical protein